MPGPGVAGRRARDRWRAPAPRRWPDRRRSGRHSRQRDSVVTAISAVVAATATAETLEDPDARRRGHGNRGKQCPRQVARVVGGGEKPSLGGIEPGCLLHGWQERRVGEATNAHRRGKGQDAAEQGKKVRRTRSQSATVAVVSTTASRIEPLPLPPGILSRDKPPASDDFYYTGEIQFMVQETLSPTAEAPDPTVTIRFGARVRAARQRQGLTLDALAAAAGISRATLSNLERGEHSPSLTAATNVARALRVSLAELLGDEDRRPVVTIPKAERLVFHDPATGIERQLLSPRLRRPRHRVHPRHPATLHCHRRAASVPPGHRQVRAGRGGNATDRCRRGVPPLAGGRRLLLPGQRLTPLREPQPRALQLPGDPRLRAARLTIFSIRVLTTGHGGCTFTVRQTRTGAIPNAGGTADADEARAQARNLSAFCCARLWRTSPCQRSACTQRQSEGR